MKTNRVGGMVAAAAALALLVSGCAAEGGTESPSGPSDSGEESAEQSSGFVPDDLIAAVESDGFVCEDKEPRLSSREEMIECRADGAIFITATRMTDTDARDKQLKVSHKVLCENDMADGVRAAVSDTWIIVPGGDRDQDIAAFDKAMTTLGLDWTEELC